MKRTILVCAVLLMTAAALGAQQADPSNAYEGVSHPPPDDTITAAAPDTSDQTPAKPPAGHRVAPSAVSSQAAVSSSASDQSPAYIPAAEQSPQAAAASTAYANDPDGGVVVAPQYVPAAEQSQEPQLNQRIYASDPDGDIVHPAPLQPGELAAGAVIRVELLERLSTADNEAGDIFRSRVASDVLQNGQVLIPAGSELDGRVAQASSGHLGGHGTMRLRPETVILPNGARYQLYADLTGTPDARAQVNGEGTIRPDSHFKRDTMEYGAVGGGGAATGAMFAGPVGALTGGLIGTGLVTAHLLINHPQATLQKGTTLLFTLAQPLQLAPAGGSGD